MDVGMTKAYSAWWEAHIPVRLSIPRVLEPGEVAPMVDRVVSGEEN